ncbi:Aste57867_16677 [Aphanomyces stellatus]|uniref:Aste57867_16677 protein n=1 Tax=Aphanomyces stellatus TaxID=120398 RepID=A0A485L6C5_9STRA|nr:hypothetical protein As57867_016620 [Aphanomyces stellatus]VFT93448.1 Aste57867_16677 [Aphanomyces stellatus]
MTARVTQHGIKKWLSDPATYPIIAILGCAGSMAVFGGLRYLTQSPDVAFSKEKRTTLLSHTVEEGEAFRAHRIAAATLKANPITRENEYQAFKERNNNA